MFGLADLIHETSASPAAGDFTLAGADTGRRPFSSAYAVGDLVPYIARHRTVAGEWEVGIGRLSATTTLVRVQIWASSNSGSVVTFTAGTVDVIHGVPADLVNLPPERCFHAYTDCITNVATDMHVFTVSGTGAAWSTLAPGTVNAIGMLRLALGTTASGRGCIAANNLGVLRLGQGIAVQKTKLRITTLSDATNTYTLRAGFIDSITGESTDGVFFRYTHGTNSGKFQAVTRRNGTESTADTGVTAAANTDYELEIYVNPDGTSAEFRINNAVVATITTNIPTASGRETGYGMMVLRSAGTAAVNAVEVDYVDTQVYLTTRR